MWDQTEQVETNVFIKGAEVDGEVHLRNLLSRNHILKPFEQFVLKVSFGP